MKYYIDGDYPIKNFLATFYEKTNGQFCCYGECVVSPKDMDVQRLTYIMDEEEKADPDADKTRLFAEMKNGDIYEFVLRKVDRENEDFSIYKI